MSLKVVSNTQKSLMKDVFARNLLIGTVIGITQPPPRDGAWSALFSNLSKSTLDNYVVNRSDRPLLEEVA